MCGGDSTSSITRVKNTTSPRHCGSQGGSRCTISRRSRVLTTPNHPGPPSLPFTRHSLSGISFIFYLPLAFFLPVRLARAHKTFNLLYQFWIHTRLIGTLGPLEWVLNTPSHHRVHHGRNPYCIDKNFAGTLIIWDRMFGASRGSYLHQHAQR